MTGGPVLLIGGTRGTGLLIAWRLAQEETPVRVFARDPVAAGKRVPPGAEIVRGDLTDAETMARAVVGVSHIIFTAGCRSGRPVSERQIKRVEYEGVVNTIAVAERAGFAGRFLYMTASGVGTRSFWAWALNVYKGNTLLWRERAEHAIRESSLAFTIVRTGVLLNSEGGRHPIRVSRERLPLSPRYRISRADVAEVFVAAMRHPRATCTSFEIAWDEGAEPWRSGLDRLTPTPIRIPGSCGCHFEGGSGRCSHTRGPFHPGSRMCAYCDEAAVHDHCTNCGRPIDKLPQPGQYCDSCSAPTAPA